jgi:hypothetical protein
MDSFWTMILVGFTNFEGFLRRERSDITSPSGLRNNDQVAGDPGREIHLPLTKLRIYG